MAQGGSAKLKGVISLGKGSRIKIHGLTNQKELNGLEGSLISFEKKKGRWGLELDDGKKVSLKMANLMPLATELAPAVEVPNLGPSPAAAVSEEQSPNVGPSPAAAVSEEQSPNVGPSPAAAVSEEQIAETSTTPSEARANKLWELDAATATAPALDTTVQSSGKDNSGYPGEAVFAPAVEEFDVQLSAAPETGGAVDAQLNNDEWPVLPTSAETTAKIQSGCWWDGGSAAKRFTEQLKADDPKLVSVVLVPPKRFNDEDAEEICSALESNTVCEELVASGHALNEETCKRLAQMLRTNKRLKTFSIGDSTMGDLARIIFDGLTENLSLTSLDLEHKGLTLEGLRSLAAALNSRKEAGAAQLLYLRLSRNKEIGNALGSLFEASLMPASYDFPAPKELKLSECGLTPKHGERLGQWVARGVENLDLRDNASFGADGIESLLHMLAASENQSRLKSLRLDGCSIGDDGLEAIAEALGQGLELEDLFIERCEITVIGCEYLSQALRGRRLRTLSVRQNVIGDKGCTLLARCAEKLDLSSTSLTGQVLPTLGEQELVSLELFSNPALGPSVSTWMAALDTTQWQRLEYLDLTGCGLGDEGWLCVVNALSEKRKLMPALKDLLMGANDVKEDDAKCDLVDKLGESRGGKLTVKWMNV